MAKLEQYQVIVQNLLNEHAKSRPANGDIEVEVSFDTERHHYQIWYLGWIGKRWLHHSPIHCAIRESQKNKIPII